MGQITADTFHSMCIYIYSIICNNNNNNNNMGYYEYGTIFQFIML